MDMLDQKAILVDILAVSVHKDQKVTLADTRVVKAPLDTWAVEDKSDMLEVVDWDIPDLQVHKVRADLKDQKEMPVDTRALQALLLAHRVLGDIPEV
jgi:hypothetical protein